eukprot:176417-Lingulodinium_polyedra.AAC.1
MALQEQHLGEGGQAAAGGETSPLSSAPKSPVPGRGPRGRDGGGVGRAHGSALGARPEGSSPY